MTNIPFNERTYIMGFKIEFDRGECDYWYTPDTFTRLRILQQYKQNALNGFYRGLPLGFMLTHEIPLERNLETREVTVDEGIINLLRTLN